MLKSFTMDLILLIYYFYKSNLYTVHFIFKNSIHFPSFIKRLQNMNVHVYDNNLRR